jgi:hypothetical protein
MARWAQMQEIISKLKTGSLTSTKPSEGFGVKNEFQALFNNNNMLSMKSSG